MVRRDGGLMEKSEKDGELKGRERERDVGLEMENVINDNI